MKIISLQKLQYGAKVPPPPTPHFLSHSALHPMKETETLDACIRMY